MRRNILALCLTIAFTSLIVNAIASAETLEQSVQSLLVEARSAQSRGDFSAAAGFYRKALEIEPSVAELWANLGLMYHELGKSSEAIESLKKAARLNPSLFVPQLFLGVEYLDIKNANAAIPYLASAAKLKPDDLQAQLSLGRAFEMLDRPDRAAPAYEKASEIAPQNGNVWLNLGTAYLQQVENDARGMASTYTNSPYYHLRAAETLAEQGKLAQAESAYKASIASASPPPCAHAEFGSTLLHENRIPEAREQFQLEAKAGSHCQLALLGIALAHLADGHPDAALKQITDAAANDIRFVQSNLAVFRGSISADQARSLFDRAQSQHDSGNLSSELASLIQQAFLSDDGSAITVSVPAPLVEVRPKPTNAEHFYKTGQYSACTQALEGDLRSLDPSQQQLLAFCSYYSGDFRATSTAAEHLKANPATKVQGLYWGSKAAQKLAVSALNHAGEIDPDSPRMHVLIGDIFRQRRRWSEAEAEYRRALALDPKSRSARLSLAIVLFTELKTEESFQIDRSLLSEMPDDQEANLLAGEILVQGNEFEKAEPYLLKCRNLNRDFAPRLHLLLGQVYAGTGRTAEAIDEYNRGLAGDENGSIHYQLGRLYLKSGDKVAAERAFAESKRLVRQWNGRALQQLDTDVSRP